MSSYLVTPIPYLICQELAKDVAASGEEWVRPPDMSNILRYKNLYRTTHLKKLVKNSILRQWGNPPDELYAFAVPVKAIKQVDRRRMRRKVVKPKPKAISVVLKKPNFYLISEFIDDVYTKSSEISQTKSETLKKRILLLKEQLFDCREDDQEFYLMQELAELSKERRDNFSEVLIDAIRLIAADEKYSAFDFKFFSLDLADYA